jgi:predicted nucleic acid-binding protein
MVLCDTNIFIEIYRGADEVHQIVKLIGKNNIVVSDVTCAELFYGARNKVELKSISTDLNNLKNLSINTEISNLAVSLVERYALSHKLSLPDALIASTAMIYDIELYTLNTKDFKFLPNLRLFYPEL